MQIEYYPATPDDLDLLSEMNYHLLVDENHRRQYWPMERIRERMAGFLRDGYQAMTFSVDGRKAGYVLWRVDPEHLYIRQFYVDREFRRQGVGRAAMQWLRENIWRDYPRLRVEVLCENEKGINFWHSLGFRDYCVTMEMELQ